MRKGKTSQNVNNQNLSSTSSSPRFPWSACGASGFWGGIWAAAGGFCTTGGSCCGGWFPWSCWTGSTGGWGNWTSGMMNSRGACNRKKDVLFPTASLKETEQEGVFYSNLVFIRHATSYRTCYRTPRHLWGVTLRYFNFASHYGCYE